MATKVVTARMPEAMVDDLDALAFKLGVDRTTVMERFLVAGLRANQLSEADRRRFIEHRRALSEGQVPGLVIPLDPLSGAHASGSAGRANEDVLPKAGEEKRWRRGRDSNP